MATVVQEPARPRVPSAPIDILNTDLAKLYTHIHPVLLLSVYAFKFNSIVENPVTALSETLVAVGILQVVFSAICLPPTGGSATPLGDKRKPGEKKKGAPSPVASAVNGTVIPAFLALVLAIIAGIPILGVLLVLFGAPISTHWEHTALCAAHISFLTAIPLTYVHGVDGSTWREIVSLELPIDEVYGCLIGTMLGAWLGAVPIPLDWDREWQKWPITIVTGAYIGFAVGKSVGGTLLKGKTVLFG
ncbi:GPI-anchor biosynthesis protein-like protein [Aaosphaeria arxii CBS 175.79]|uniref:GPI-anchor biosynthesis protein-like protein n=1 Tax=Aaosphaeria arxii CBS 175.79 TaxID=1450172 RepID=A0A6A5XF53_9PLEO|nr:GPI-anchor biosynthesis protein-like protein [Aaosphaeria arxii CBS 175.79]KAF2011447.1 GPI-anchor biosynthesis protein-like protein [Aaosphaeria arxii CBS 175.79]